MVLQTPLCAADCSVQGRVRQLKEQTSLIILFQFFQSLRHALLWHVQRSCCPHLNQEDIRLVLWLLKGKFSLYRHNNEQPQERTDQSGQFQKVNTALL